MNLTDLVWMAVAFILTVLVLSYAVVGDNPFFRGATYAFVGIVAGYVLLVTFNQVIWPKLVLNFFRSDLPVTEKGLLLVPLVLSLLLLAKASPRLAGLGSLPVALLVGVGAAVMISGVVLGTLFPQTMATINAFDVHSGRAQTAGVALAILEGVVLLAGTGATLLYFQFSAHSRFNQLPQRGALVETAANVGQVFIAITLGALFAGVYSAALTALIERLSFLWNSIF
ncbi:MAG: hypothetical protein PHQ40_09505 [Anaerolineaceae bacterium]|nr:hypothetical protein [Anaerolineaceae bacterium]